MEKEMVLDSLTVEYLEIIDANENCRMIFNGGGTSGTVTFEIIGENTIKMIADKEQAKIILNSSNSSIEINISDDIPNIILRSKDKKIKLSLDGLSEKL